MSCSLMLHINHIIKYESHVTPNLVDTISFKQFSSVILLHSNEYPKRKSAETAGNWIIQKYGLLKSQSEIFRRPNMTHRPLIE